MKTRPKHIVKGDTVEILMAKHFPQFRHRKLPVKGTVMNVDGAYVLVKPFWCNYVIEQYTSELRKT